MPELLGRREIGLPPAGAKTVQMNCDRKARAHERACSHLYMYYVIVVTTGQ